MLHEKDMPLANPKKPNPAKGGTDKEKQKDSGLARKRPA